MSRKPSARPRSPSPVASCCRATATAPRPPSSRSRSSGRWETGFEQAPAELPLGDYLESLRLVRELPDHRLLPAHGPVSPSVHHRVDELIDHHDVRLRQIRAAVEAGATTASEAAHRLRWTRREHRFDELDLFGRCLAVTETMAHLDVLAVAGRLRRTDTASVSCYTTA